LGLISKSNKHIFIGVLKIAIKFPIAILKQINLSNWKTLKRAILNEPPDLIFNNIKSLLQNTQDFSIKKSSRSINRFIKEIETSYEEKEIIICVSHEATRTGAPAIIMNIGKHVKEEALYFPIFILIKGGSRHSDFIDLSPTYLLANSNSQNNLNNEIGILLTELKKNCKIRACLFNSEGTTHLLKPFTKLNIENKISLVHEMGNYYPPDAWKHIDKYSNTVIFPSETIKRYASINTRFYRSTTVVHGQGLMKTKLLQMSKQNSKKAICKNLNIPFNSTIVLGCGLADARKGIDLFTSIAIHTIRNLDEEIYFIWIGEAKRNEFQIWVERDIETSKLSNKILFIGSKKDPSAYFCGSDIFLMSSRGDPFPCVSQEALAAGLPVIAFKDAGGTPDMLTKETGFVVPYADVVTASIKIRYLAKNQIVLDKMSLESRKHAALNHSFKEYYHSIKRYWN